MNKSIEIDIYNLITNGIIKERVSFYGVPVIFKSLNHIDTEDLVDLSWGNDEKFITLSIAYSMLKVGGVDVLKVREQALDKIVSVINCFSSSCIRVASSVVINLDQRLKKCMDNLDDFVDSPVNTVLWHLYKREGNLFPKSIRERVGYSPVFTTWVSQNSLDDEINEIERAYDIGTFVGSFYNPKGARSVMSHMAAKREARAKEKELHARIESGGMTKPTKTREDLAEQLQNQISGVKDKHDKVIEQAELKMWGEVISEHQQKMQQILKARATAPEPVLNPAIRNVLEVQRETMRVEEKRRRAFVNAIPKEKIQN